MKNLTNLYPKIQTEILTFIRKNCYKKTLKIKTITNLNNKFDDYLNEIIIQCKFKS